MNHKQQEQLHQALLSAFPGYNSLERMVRFGLDENLEAIAGSGKLEDVVFNLIAWAVACGREVDLVRAARQSNPGNAELQAFAQSVGIQELDTHSDRLRESLLRLDYYEQEDAFREFVEGENRVGAFLIHGSRYYGQTWLLSRLVRLHLQHSTTAEKIRIGLGRHARSTGIDSLWRELSSKVGLRPPGSSLDIAQRIVDMCQHHRHVILIFDEVDAIEPYFEDFIAHFWHPLAKLAQRAMLYTGNSRLIMFLVDSCGVFSTYNSTFADHHELHREVHTPVRLPSIAQFSDSVLLRWMEHERGMLPRNLYVQREQIVQDILQGSENGTPEFVLERICYHCGYDWYEKEQIWLKI